MGMIVVADDSDLDRDLTRRGLRRHASEHSFQMFEDGERAVAYLQDAPHPDLVLLDHRMPKMGAEDVLVALKTSHANTNFVLFSSAVSPVHVERCLELGVREYVEKPTDPAAYIDLVGEIVHCYLS